MTALEILKSKLKSREDITIANLSNSFDTEVPTTHKNAGTDMLLFDLEHGLYTPESAGDMLMSCRKIDMIAITRVADYDYHCISRPLDMGSDGILLPRTETVEQVGNAIKCMRFYPRGKKGVGGRGLLKPGETIEDFNNNRLFFVQIESPTGVNNLDDILSKHSDEIAGILIGPCDLAITCGCGLDTKADIVVENIRKVVKTCKAHNMSVGINMSKSLVKHWSDEGMNLFWM